MIFRLPLKSVTLSDIERRNGPYFALFRGVKSVINSIILIPVLLRLIHLISYMCKIISFLLIHDTQNPFNPSLYLLYLLY